jgi:hypothetical protein
MGTNRFYCFKDTDFSEFVYHALVTASSEAKANLSTTELSKLNYKHGARRFSDNEGLEKQLFVLTRLGYSFCVLVAHEDAKVQNILSDTGTQFTEVGKRDQVIKLMHSDRFFAFGSRDIMLLSHMAAQNSHSQAYSLNWSYLKLKDSLSANGVEITSKTMVEAKKAMAELVSWSLQSLLAKDIIEAICEVDEMQLKILMATFPYRGTYVSAKTIADQAGEQQRSRAFAQKCNWLQKFDYLERAPGHRRSGKKMLSFTITEKGINTLFTYIRYVSKKVLV